MNLIKNKRWFVLCSVLVLMMLYHGSVDELYIKQSEYLSNVIEYFKIISLTLIAYMLAKILECRCMRNIKLKSISPNHLFLFTFLILNSYTIGSYTSRMVTHHFLNNNLRNHINDKTKLLPFAGKGYTCEQLNYEEFKELTRYSTIIDIPRVSNDIYVLNWSEFDYLVTIEFNLPKEFNLTQFYLQDTLILKSIKEIKSNDTYLRSFENDPIKFDFDTLQYKRYKYEISSQ